MSRGASKRAVSTKRKTTIDPRLAVIAQAALDTKANGVELLDLTGLSSLCDYFVITSADSTRRVRAIADAIEEELDSYGSSLHHKEGCREAQWILMNYGAIVVHIFYTPVRDFYGLGTLWAHAPRIPVPVPGAVSRRTKRS